MVRFGQLVSSGNSGNTAHCKHSHSIATCTSSCRLDDIISRFPNHPFSIVILIFFFSFFFSPDEFNIHSLCSDQPEQVIEYLAKVIAAQLRDARENRRLVCRELFLPNDLLGNIAAKVRTLAETEPCGLRGCKFYICIEDKEAAAAAASVSTSGTLLNSGTNSTTQSMTSGDSLQQQHSNSQSWVNSRLLGEVALDRTMVPTFEVFLTLKPTLPNWFDALESRLFGRERIILAENYLLHKKKLYHQNTAPTSNM